MKKRRILITVLVILLMILVSLGAYVFFFMEPKENLSTMYLSSDTNVQYVLDEELNEVSFVRGTEVSLSDRIKKIDDKEYYKLYINDNVYFIELNDIDIEVNKEVYDTFNESELHDINEMNEYDRHIYHYQEYGYLEMKIIC